MFVQDVYTRVCSPLNEPAGFILGLVSYPQFSDYLTDCINDFMRQTGLAKIFATQSISYGIGQYTLPDAQMNCEQVFVQARFIPRSSLDSIDNSLFQWKRKIGVPKVWHDDGLAIKTVELPLAPNWQGAVYEAAVQPGLQLISNSTVGNFSGTVNTNGQAVSLVSGDPFQASDATWQGKKIVINGVNYQIGVVVDTGDLLLVNGQSAGVQNDVPYSVSYPVTLPAADRNLTTYGSELPAATSYALTDTIPLMPDSAAIYLSFGVLQKIYSDDAELKDSQKAKYCAARYQEGINLFRAALLEQMGDDGDE